MSDARIIESLGNTVRVAKALGMDRRVVSNWKNRGISAPGLALVVKLATEKGVELPKRITARLAKIRARNGQPTPAE